jgi:acetyl/propionyl-CoA carboxylase alpha subunit/acetyl-CoA carboxylase carboxyltransferase component
LAIVNRGEAAMRALTAVAELNQSGDEPKITTVVLYTDPDARAWFVREADEAIALGPATWVDPADGHRKSRYLDEARVIDALVRARVDTVWVGWGFVSEHATFSKRCEDAGIVFVGPDSETIRLLGDKVAGKRLAESCAVPVVPWSGGPVDDVHAAAEHAARLGYPVVLKASAGGWGRGIRIVARHSELAAELESARGEAELAFGDPTVFLEQLVPAARHVDVQIIADAHGTVWAVGVRDCTIRRRNQKVIGESGSTVLTPEAELAIKDAAVRLASAAGYRNAGTAEFLVDPETGAFLFMEFNTRLQAEHPVTEETIGIDLVKLQLHIARGGRLDAQPPPVHGHAAAAQLRAEDPERGFVSAPGRLALLIPPSGSGIRVDAGVREGDDIAPGFDSMIAKVIARGRDRAEALSRLRRALSQTTAVVDGGTTNRSFLLALLDREEVKAGRFDDHWLDGLIAGGGHLSPPDPVALLQAAVETYGVEEAATRAGFHSRARRGRPAVPAEVGHRCQLRYRGVSYSLRVFRTGPSTYRVDHDGVFADITIDRINSYECRVEVGGRRHRVVSVVEGSTIRVEVDGAAHRVSRTDGGVIRSGWPSFVVSVLVNPGGVVSAGDPLVVVESMKMAATIAAPFGGEVASVAVAPNTQVDAGAPLLRISDKDGGSGEPATTAPVDLSGLVNRPGPGTPPCDDVYSTLVGYLLGYDLDPSTLRGVLARQQALGEAAPPADARLLRCEDGLLDLFAEIGALQQVGAAPETGVGAATAGGRPEHLRSYLQWLDTDRAGLPEDYRELLVGALRRYRVGGLDRTPALEEAVVWLYRSVRRLDELAPVVVNILQRRLGHRDDLTGFAGPDLRARLDRLAAATQGRRQVVADLARDMRFSFLDQPLLAGVVEEEYARAAGHFAALQTRPDRPDRDELISELVRCSQPLRAALLRRWLAEGGMDYRCALLEVYARRYYRIRDLRNLRFSTHDGQLLAAADYDIDNRSIHLVVGYTPLERLPEFSHAVAAHLEGEGKQVWPPSGPSPAAVGDRRIVVDVGTWRTGEPPTAEESAAQIADLITVCDFGRRLWRLDVTVSSLDAAADPSTARQVGINHATFRQREDGVFTEELLYRGLHPMLAKRMDMWRLSNFRLERLPSSEDVYLFHGVANENPADHRLFALAEVRDLTPVQDAAGTVSYPRLELMGLSALAAMRRALAEFPDRDQPVANRLILYVRQPFDLPPDSWQRLARGFLPLAVGARLEKAVLRVGIPEPGGSPRESTLHVEVLDGEDVTITELPPGDDPIRPLTQYRQKVLRAARLGAPYPFQIVRMLAPRPGILTRFPPGGFVEYDLDEASGAVVPVAREPGLNSANVVVGVITNVTEAVPEGMSRVVLLGDPTRGLGNLAEPECRRINAALDLAERMAVPLEWFTLSSGARIAMDSGTENMDWISAVLRRIIEFTQAGGELNIVATGVNVGAQPYWNAEATMLMHTRGILVMTPASAMVLTGKQALDVSGGVSAEDNSGIGGFDQIMGPNGQGQYWAPSLEDACEILLRHYEYSYVVPGERYPRRTPTGDPADRDVRTAPHAEVPGSDLLVVGDIFSAERNQDRKKPFDIRSVLRAVVDTDCRPLERWAQWHGADTAVVWDAKVGGIPVCMLGVESQTVPRRGFVPAGGPPSWTSGTLFPQSSRKIARAVNSASGNRPLVVLANLSGFDGSPESMRRWQLEYGAEIGRAVTNFRGPIVFMVISRYHGGAFVVFSKRLNPQLEIVAVEGSFASVIGGAAAASTVFARDVRARTDRDPRVKELREQLAHAPDGSSATLRAALSETTAAVRSEKLGEVADEFDRIHSIQRAMAVGSVDRIITADRIRPYIVEALERGMAADMVPIRTPVADG